MYIDLTEEGFQKLSKVTEENKSAIAQGTILVFGMVETHSLKMNQFSFFVVTNEVTDSILKLTCIAAHQTKVWEFDKTYVVILEELMYTPPFNKIFVNFDAQKLGVEWRIYA